MTTTEIRESLAAIDSAMSQLSDSKYALVLALEEAEGRPESREARFARAALSHDVDAMTRLCAEGQVANIRRYGPDPVRAEVERILAERDAAADADLLADRPSHEVAAPESI